MLSNLPIKKILMFRTLVLIFGVSIIFFLILWTYHFTQIESSDDYLSQSRKNIGKTDDLNYGVVVDCGSSGSRLFVYYWKKSNEIPGELLNITSLLDSENKPVVLKIEPGLSTFSENPSGVIEYITPLLQYAVDHIPEKKIKETPLFLIATAGMRLISENNREAILTNLKHNIPKKFDFLFSDSHVEVISGKWEGLYAWISINLAFGKFGPQSGEKVLKKWTRKTVGAMDLGGASMQATFELPMDINDPLLKGSVMDLELGTTGNDYKFRLFTQTFLGFGANEAQRRLILLLYHNAFKSSSDTQSHPWNKVNSIPKSSSVLISHNVVNPIEHNNATSNFLNKIETSTSVNDISHNLVNTGTKSSERKKKSIQISIENPCLNKGYKEKLDLSQYSISINHSVVFEGTGDLDKCINLLNNLLNKTTCPINKHCAMQGIVMPDTNYRNMDFYGFSEFFYTMNDIFDIAGNYDYYTFYNKARDYCDLSWEDVEHMDKEHIHPKSNTERYKSQCFKSAWMVTILHDGFNLPKQYKHFTSIKDIGGKEVHWSLGVLLYKTRYYPLRNVESKLGYQSFHSKHAHTMEFTMVLFLVCLITSFGVYFCLKYCKLFKKNSREIFNTNDFDPHIVIVNKSQDKKMIRSRSSGTFNNPAFSEV